MSSPVENGFWRLAPADVLDHLLQDIRLGLELLFALKLMSFSETLNLEIGRNDECKLQLMRNYCVHNLTQQLRSGNMTKK